MESLVPSEIARLVYGYLIEENCEAAAQLFLETSSSLKECLVLQKKKRKFNTTVLGLTLVDILNLYTDAVCLVKNYLSREDSLNHALSELVKELGNVLVIDNDSRRNISKTVFLRISVPNKKNARRKSLHLENIEEEEEDEEEKTEKESQPNEQNKSNVDGENILAKNNLNSSSDEFDLNILQTLIDNTALHERLAENINKAIDSSGETTNHKTDEKKIIETILHNTEADPIFHELLDELVAPQTEDTTTPEDTDKENGDPAEERQVPLDCGNTINEDLETSKKIAEESNFAIEGILAGNKKMQEEQVNQEPQPTETIVISSPQAIATSSGIYKQSIIIPAGYTVTDVFPASQISTPLQPINMANLATFGHLSPILPHPVSVTKQSGSIRGSLQPRRRRILPKTETPSSFYIQIPTQDDQVQEVKVDIPTPQKRLTENIKGSRVRTRGGLQKVGIRGVKAIVPQMAKPVDSGIQVLVSPVGTKKSNTSGIRTRAMSKRNDKDKKDIVKPPVIEVVQPLSNEEPQQTEMPSEKDSLPEKNIEKPKEDCVDANDITEATPQQQAIPKHPRVSLSTPRRTHVRALDFETPDKNLALRKSMTSPKVYHQSKKEPKALEFIKRGGMFNSPPKETPQEEKKPVERKVKKNWDADLRNFMASRENLDIPTSVGLKRKAGTRRGDKSACAKRKVTRKKVTKKPLKKKNSNEELVDQIEKDVRDVIGDDEIALNTSHNSELGNLIEQKLMEEIAKNDSSSLEVGADPKQQSEVIKSPDIPEETTTKEITKDALEGNDGQKQPEPHVSNNEDCTNVPEKHDEDIIPEEFNTSTPLKLNMSPVNENSRGQLTPTTKLVMSHLGKVSTRFPSVFSPTSQSSLENILIKECSRMETEKTSNIAQDIEKLSPPKPVSCGNDQTTEPKPAEPKKDDTNIVDKPLTFESVCKNSVNLFQTPAKFLSAPIPPGTPVEMTPLTKVLVSETSFAATVLVTPTLPPTPKNPLSVTPQKIDESPVGSTNLSGKETDKPQGCIVNSTNTINEKPMNKENIENPQLQPDAVINTPPTLVIDHSNNRNVCIEKNKDFDGASENINKKSNSVISEKKTCKTPKIKLMSPKLNKNNEPLVKKKTNIFIEQHKSKVEGNASKQIQGLPKVHSDNSFDGKYNEPVIDLDNSNNSEQSDNNSLERTVEGKVNKKPAPRETKKLTLSRKKTCLERNNKSLKKSPKSNIGKPSKKMSVDEEMESEIRHLLKDTKAKLFGPDNSSDSASDSSINDYAELKKSSVQLKTARERLQKLENIRMLNSSSSTSDESSDDEAVVKPKVSEKDSKGGVPGKKIGNFNEEDGMECSSLIAKHSKDGPNTKKADGSSTSKLIESSKVISKEIEESCESFPTLHLSEESNQSLKLDNNLAKCPKSRKSPLSEVDLAGKKTSSLLLAASFSRASVEKAKASNDPRKTPNTTINIEEQINLIAKSKNYHESHLNERYFNIYSNTVKPKLHGSEEKLNLARSQALTEYLDSYVYSFTLNVDKSGNYLNKKLRSSPFLHIFEFGETQPHSPYLRKDERRIDTPRTDQRPRPRSGTRNRKRSRSPSSSEDEKDKRDYSRGYGSFRGERKKERDRDRFFRSRGGYARRDSFPRKKFRDMRSHHDSRYRDYDHYSPYDKKRSRHSSPEFRRNIKKEDRRPLEDKLQSSKYRIYSNVNDSFTSSKSGSEVEGRHSDMNRTYSPEVTFEAQKERCSTSSSQRLVVEDQPSFLRPQSQSYSRKSKLSLDSVREDGELSDSSEVKRISPAGSRSAVLSLDAHDSRAKLLNKVDLDQFLSIVHGEED